MAEMFDEILDRCIDRINRGERIEDCIADYPQHAEELQPLLESMLSTEAAYPYKTQFSARQKARQRFNAALKESEEKREKSRLPFPWIFGRARAWAVIAAIAVIAFGGYLGIMHLTSQETNPDIIPATANPDGNFAFFISDAPNAIGDFQNLDLTVSLIRLHQEDGDWVEFVPETGQVDLTQLQDDWAQQIWRGDVPEGQYSGAVLFVSDTSGVLKNTDETVIIGLNGGKLQLDIDFKVAADTEGVESGATDFVYDITVQDDTNGRYNLKPVAGESGTDKPIRKMEMHGQTQGQLRYGG